MSHKESQLGSFFKSCNTFRPIVFSSIRLTLRLTWILETDTGAGIMRSLFQMKCNSKLFTAWSMSNKISFRQTSWYCVCRRASISSVFISSQTHYECDIVDNSSITPSRSIYHVTLYQIMSLNKAAMTPDSYAIRSYLFLVNPLGPFCHAYCQRQPHWKQQHNHINDIWIQWLWEQSQLQCSYVFLLKFHLS